MLANPAIKKTLRVAPELLRFEAAENGTPS
jgi:hypothetical protein